MNDRDQEFIDVTIENVRTYWDSRPCNVRHSPKPPGTKEYFDEVESRKYFVEPHIPRFSQFEAWRKKRVLEIGCGIGTDTVNFARNGAQVTAVELSEESLGITRKRLALYGVENNVRLYQGNAEHLSGFVPVEQYDLVYSFGVIHHTPHPSRVLDEICFYLKEKGVLKIMVYHRYSWKVFWILFTYGKGRFWKLDQIVAQHSEAQTGCPVTYTFSKKQLRALLEAHGFKITEQFVEHIFPYKISDYVQYRYVKAWAFRWMPLSLFRWLEKRIGWHLCVTAEKIVQ